MLETSLDSELMDKPKELISKTSILICAFLASPLTAGLLYASNLHRIEKSNKIVSNLILISLSDFFVHMSFVGFELPIPFVYIHFVLNLVTGFFMIIWLWNQHFSSESYQEKFELNWIVLAVIVFYCLEYLRGFILKLISQPPSSILERDTSLYMSHGGKFEFIFIAIIILFIIRIVQKIRS